MPTGLTKIAFKVQYLHKFIFTLYFIGQESNVLRVRVTWHIDMYLFVFVFLVQSELRAIARKSTLLDTFAYKVVQHITIIIIENIEQ